jgi:hypothetical protein
MHRQEMESLYVKQVLIPLDPCSKLRTFFFICVPRTGIIWALGSPFHGFSTQYVTTRCRALTTEKGIESVVGCDSASQGRRKRLKPGKGSSSTQAQRGPECATGSMVQRAAPAIASAKKRQQASQGGLNGGRDVYVWPARIKQGFEFRPQAETVGEERAYTHLLLVVNRANRATWHR